MRVIRIAFTKLCKALGLVGVLLPLALMNNEGLAAPASHTQTQKTSVTKTTKKTTVTNKKTTSTQQKKSSKATSQKKTASAKKNKSSAKANNKKSVTKAPSEKETLKKRDELKTQQASLQEQLDDLKKRLSETEASHNEASDALAASEAAISKVNRRLRNLGSERARVENRLKELREQERAVSGQLTDAEKQIRVIAQAQYLNTQRDSWQTLIAGSNPHEIARDAAALRYFAQAEERAAHRLAYRQANIQSVSEETLIKRKELANIESREREDRAQLVKDQADRKQALTKLQKQISEQRASIDKMERDQARLGELVANIDKLLAKQKAEAQRLAEKARQQQKTGKSVASGGYVPPLKGQFAKLKGRLMMPALGKIVGRFGQARANVSGKSTTWKGLQIQAKQGSDVLACAAGQVVFSDWLRGFGNLIIIDHGDGFLSIYGNNESLYKSVGDRIQRGDTIASVGNTGGEDLPGLYFELRHNGRPFNPLPWIGKE